jgi:hypothetical protein
LGVLRSKGTQKDSKAIKKVYQKLGFSPLKMKQQRIFTDVELLIETAVEFMKKATLLT